MPCSTPPPPLPPRRNCLFLSWAYTPRPLSGSHMKGLAPNGSLFPLRRSTYAPPPRRFPYTRSSAELVPSSLFTMFFPASTPFSIFLGLASRRVFRRSPTYQHTHPEHFMHIASGAELFPPFFPSSNIVPAPPMFHSLRSGIETVFSFPSHPSLPPLGASFMRIVEHLTVQAA